MLYNKIMKIDRLKKIKDFIKICWMVLHALSMYPLIFAQVVMIELRKNRDNEPDKV